MEQTRRITCYVIWNDGVRSHFSFWYDEEELRRHHSFREFLIAMCLSLFPHRTETDIKWILRD